MQAMFHQRHFYCLVVVAVVIFGLHFLRTFSQNSKVYNITMKTSFVTASYVLCFLVSAGAFCFDSPASKSTWKSTTMLHAEEPARSPKRRSVLGNMKKTLVGAATLAAFRQKPAPVLAEDIMQSPGRVVQLEIANLEGVEGNIGIVKIKLQSEWAPRGVKRFEVGLKLGKPLHTYNNCELFLISSLYHFRN
jgi:hypothetical protein